MQELRQRSVKEFQSQCKEKDSTITQLRNDCDQLRTSLMSTQEQLKQVMGRDQSSTIEALNSQVQALEGERKRLVEEVCARCMTTISCWHSLYSSFHRLSLCILRR